MGNAEYIASVKTSRKWAVIGSGQEGQSCSHKKCFQVFKSHQSEWSRWAACGVNKHKGEVSAQRNLRHPYLKQGAGHNSAYVHPAQAFEMLKSGVWDFLVGNGKSARAWDGSTGQSSHLSHQVGGWEHPCLPWPQVSDDWFRHLPSLGEHP